MGKVKSRKVQSAAEKKESNEKKLMTAEPVIVSERTPLMTAPGSSPTSVLLTNVAPLNQKHEEVYFEVDSLQTLENRIKRKDILLQEQQKKIRSLKQRITRLEEEARNRNRTIVSYQTELIQFSKDLEDRQSQIKALEASVDELCRQIEVLQKEKQTAEEAKQNLLAENQAFKEKGNIQGKEINNFKVELKQKAQEIAAMERELKEGKRVYRELQESFDILLNQNTDLDRQNNEMKRVREEMETRYARTLDNLKAEVRIRQSECSKLLRELQDLKREREDLERLVDGIELKTEMLTSKNTTLQRRLDRVLQEKMVQDELLKSWLVRAALGIVRFFSRYTTPEDGTLSANERSQGF